METVYCEHDGRTYFHVKNGFLSVWMHYNSDIDNLSFSHGSFFNGVSSLRAIQDFEVEEIIDRARKEYSKSKNF